MMIRPGGACAVILAVSLLAGCAGTDPAGTAPVAAPAGGSGSPSVADPADPAGKTAPADPGTVPVDPAPLDPAPSGKPGATGIQTLTGTVTAGVEPDCLMLTGVTGTHQLIISDTGARAAAKVGASVIVVGRVDPRMMTTCQQGTPFVVSQVRPG
jgi:hypothetical protein